MDCLRLSWDDELNDWPTRRLLEGRFENFALTMGTAQKSFDRYIEDLDLHSSNKDVLRKQFRNVAQTVLGFLEYKETVTREDLYKAFIIMDGTQPVERHYDRKKA